MGSMDESLEAWAEEELVDFVELRWVEGQGMVQVDEPDAFVAEYLHYLRTGESTPEIHAFIAAREACES